MNKEALNIYVFSLRSRCYDFDTRQMFGDASFIFINILYATYNNVVLNLHVWRFKQGLVLRLETALFISNCIEPRCPYLQCKKVFRVYNFHHKIDTMQSYSLSFDYFQTFMETNAPL